MKTIVHQLVDIYYNEENWHTHKMPFESALRYHKTRYENGTIHTYEENEEVLGYYERYIKDDTCILYNLWIRKDKRKGKVFKELYKHFLSTMPDNIKYIVGEKVKLGGKYQKVTIGRKYGDN